MDSELQKNAQETFNALPKDIQEVIFADDYKRILGEIVKKYSLTNDQLDKLENETTLILMGVIVRSYYPFNLESELGLDEDTAQAIANDITDTVFAEVKASLDKMDADKVGDEATLNAKIDYEEKKMDEQSVQLEAGAPAETEPIKNNSAPLTTLADRLKKASIASPTTRDQSLDKTPSLPAQADSSRSAIDPYHESIDNS
jgi:hypothetical protein